MVQVLAEFGRLTGVAAEGWSMARRMEVAGVVARLVSRVVFPLTLSEASGCLCGGVPGGRAAALIAPKARPGLQPHITRLQACVFLQLMVRHRRCVFAILPGDHVGEKPKLRSVGSLASSLALRVASCRYPVGKGADRSVQAGVC